VYSAAPPPLSLSLSLSSSKTIDALGPDGAVERDQLDVAVP
jgi:hypothetical protein